MLDLVKILHRFEITVEIDPILFQHMDNSKKQQIKANKKVHFTLFNLILYTGLLTARFHHISKFSKFFNKLDLIKIIKFDSSEFRIKISEYQNRIPETLKSVSEDLGMGFSALITSYLFKIQFNSIAKIHGTKKRADWECKSDRNERYIIEAKGTINEHTRNRQKEDALIQKNTDMKSNLRIASLALLKENVISDVEYIDPPNNFDEPPSEVHQLISRAEHYIAFFSFLGLYQFGHYFLLMKKKLESLQTFDEINEKEKIFQKLKHELPKLTYLNRTFVGSFTKTTTKQIVFAGVEENLLWFRGFQQFNSIESINEYFNDNYYYLMPNGILIVIIKNISKIIKKELPPTIPSYLDLVTITDIDEMNSISFYNFVTYLFIKNKIEFTDRKEDFPNYIRFKFNQQEYLFILLVFKDKNSTNYEIINSLLSRTDINNGNITLITNSIIEPKLLGKLDTKIKFIDRIKLMKIIKKHSELFKDTII